MVVSAMVSLVLLVSPVLLVCDVCLSLKENQESLSSFCQTRHTAVASALLSVYVRVSSVFVKRRTTERRRYLWGRYPSLAHERCAWHWYIG